MRHQRTFRGHKLAVYCLAFDRSGRKIVTGEGPCWRGLLGWSDCLLAVMHCCRDAATQQNA
jgi:hypothetical protein